MDQQLSLALMTGPAANGPRLLTCKGTSNDGQKPKLR
jgi:hypothetical protein